MKKYTREELKNIGIHDLRNLARDIGVKNPTAKMKKEDLIEAIIDIQEGRLMPVPAGNRGRPPISKKGEYPAFSAGGASMLSERKRQAGYAAGSSLFDSFKPVRATKEVGGLFGIKMGQRVLIASHEAADALKTLKELTTGLNGVKLFTLFIDASPEDATDFAETAAGEKIISPIGTPHTEHINTAGFYLSHAKQLAAEGEDVVFIIFSFDALYRAFYQKNSSEALTEAQAFFGAGRCLEGAGSLTVIGFAKDNQGLFLDSLSALANAKICMNRDGKPDPEKSFNR